MPTCRYSLLVAVALCLASAVSAIGQETKTASKGKLLMITGEDRFHDWRDSGPALRKVLEDFGFTVVVVEDPWVLTTEGIKGYDGLVMHAYPAQRWPGLVEEAMIRLVRDGMGIGIVHSADNAFPGWKEYEDMVGLLWRDGAGHDRFGPYTVKIVDQEHFITRGMSDFPITDELYRDLTKYSEFHTLAQAFSRDKQRDYPLIMVKTYGKGRVFHNALGHNSTSIFSEGFKTTMGRGMLWAIKRDQ